jgi:hypothetical protein
VTYNGPTDDYRAMSLSGFVVGYWFDPSGAPQAIKTDMSYERRVSIGCSADAQAAVPAFFFTRYRWNTTLNSCEVQGDLDTLITPPERSYNWTYNSIITVTEEIKLSLIVGTEVSSASLRYEYEYRSEMDVLSDIVPPQGFGGFAGLSGAINRAERLFLNDVMVDELIYPVEVAGVGVGPIKMAFDRNNTFAGAVPSQWLPALAESFHSIGASRPAAALRLYWLSNRLVGLREIVRGTTGVVVNGPVTRNNYGPTAYPGGVNPTEYNSLAMIGGSVRALYGARSPLTGAMTLGQLEKVVYI